MLSEVEVQNSHGLKTIINKKMREAEKEKPGEQR